MCSFSGLRSLLSEFREQSWRGLGRNLVNPGEDRVAGRLSATMRRWVRAAAPSLEGTGADTGSTDGDSACTTAPSLQRSSHVVELHGCVPHPAFRGASASLQRTVAPSLARWSECSPTSCRKYIRKPFGNSHGVFGLRQSFDADIRESLAGGQKGVGDARLTRLVVGGPATG